MSVLNKLLRQIEQQHVKQNPNYPYAKGYPLIVPLAFTGKFHPDQVVRATPWITKHWHMERAIVLNARLIKYHRRQEWITQILVITGTGETKWFHEDHFEPLLN